MTWASINTILSFNTCWKILPWRTYNIWRLTRNLFWFWGRGIITSIATMGRIFWDIGFSLCATNTRPIKDVVVINCTFRTGMRCTLQNSRPKAFCNPYIRLQLFAIFTFGILFQIIFTLKITHTATCNVAPFNLCLTVTSRNNCDILIWINNICVTNQLHIRKSRLIVSTCNSSVIMKSNHCLIPFISFIIHICNATKIFSNYIVHVNQACVSIQKLAVSIKAKRISSCNFITN